MADEKGHDVTNVPSIIVTWVNELKLKKLLISKMIQHL